MPAITMQDEGSRVYALGDTYSLRNALKSAGCHWDAERRAWWIGAAKRSALERIVGSPPTAPAAPDNGDSRPERKAPGTSATVAGRAEYKGKTYYIAGRVVRGRTHWDDQVAEVATRDGAKVLLYSRDGSFEFWAAVGDVRVTKSYRKPTTIGGLQEFARTARENGGTHPNACSYCGSTSCSAAYGRGGLCDED